jgi:hypothetical protein
VVVVVVAAAAAADGERGGEGGEVRRPPGSIALYHNVNTPGNGCVVMNPVISNCDLVIYMFHFNSAIIKKLLHPQRDRLEHPQL